MAFWVESAAEASTTLDADFSERRPTDEDGQTQVPPTSPDDSTECFDHFDLGDLWKPPQRRETYPFDPPSPSQAHVLKPITANSAYPTARKRRVVPPIPRRTVHTESNWAGPHPIRHASTMDTYHSASFDDTAVWDQKAILSLGMYLVQSECVAP